MKLSKKQIEAIIEELLRVYREEHYEDFRNAAEHEKDSYYEFSGKLRHFFDKAFPQT